MNHAINFKELRRQERKKRLQKRMKNASEAETANIGVNQKKDGNKTPRGHENIQHNSNNVDHFFCDESHSVCSPHALRKLECDVGEQSQEGVFYINNFLSPEYTAALLHFLKRGSSTMHNDSKSAYIDHVGKWTSLKHAKRRVLLLDSTIQAFPKPVQNIVDILQKLYPKEARINHVLINEYEAGQGILPHTDGPIYFPKTCTISLSSSCIFKFRTQSNSPSKMEVLLQDKSLIVFENDAYKNYLHGIDETFEEKISEKCHKFTSSFHNDVSIPFVGETITRSYRVSLTFRHKYPSKSANIK